MDKIPYMTSLRNMRGFNRSWVYLVIVALVGVVFWQVAQYTYLKGSSGLLGNPSSLAQMPKQEPSETEKLAQTVINVRDTLKKFDVAAAANQNTTAIESEVKAYRGKLAALDKQVMADFDKVKQHIVDRHLPEVIQQRQADAVAKYKAEYQKLLTNLTLIETASTPEAKRVAVQQVRAQLDQMQMAPKQQPFDPNNLPFKSMQPNPENKPKLTKKQFAQAGLYNTPLVQYAALGNFTYSNLAGASDPAYLQETDEVKLTPAIQAKATELQHDPVQIYNWVRNNVEWIPSWGAMQDSDVTLGSLRGNAFDIASLLIALYRASGIPARYVHGTIEVPEDKFRNWAGGFVSAEAAGNFASSGGIPIAGVVQGGVISKFQLEHIWVEAAIDYQPSRGAKNYDADTWVQLDPSYKQYQFLQGLDVQQITGVDAAQLAMDFTNSGTVNTVDGWFSGLNSGILQDAQQQVQVMVQNYITTNLPNATMGEVVGGQRIIPVASETLPSSVSNTIKVLGMRYSSLPMQLQVNVTFQLGVDTIGQPVGQMTLSWARVNNHKVTLSYRPATPIDEAVLISLLPSGSITNVSQLPGSIPSYLINVIPELALDNQVISTGVPIRLGEEINFAITTNVPSYGAKKVNSLVVAGSYLSVATVSGRVSPAILQTLQARIDSTRLLFDSNDFTQLATMTRERILGDQYYVGVLSYFAQFQALTYSAGLKQKIHQNMLPSTGTYGYAPSVRYLFGFPQSINPGGMRMDLNNINTFTGTSTINHQQIVKFVQQIGMLSSVLEHSISEQMYILPDNQDEAVSAAKALAIANSTGQRIFELSKANLSSVLPQLHHDSNTLGEIINAVNLGKIVITHTDPVNVPGWSGFGYVIQNPETGGGAYKISDGSNGSFKKLLDPVLQYVTLGQGGLESLMKQDTNFISEFKNSPFFKAFSALGSLLGITSLLTDIFDFAAHCGTEAAMVFSIAFTIIAVGTLALALFLTPVVAFIAAVLIQFVASQLKTMLLSSRLCPF